MDEFEGYQNFEKKGDCKGAEMKLESDEWSLTARNIDRFWFQGSPVAKIYIARVLSRWNRKRGASGRMSAELTGQQ